MGQQLSDGDRGRLFDNLLTLIGYGCPKAPIWFIGIEDGGGGWTDKGEVEAQGPAAIPERYYAMPKRKICEESAGYDKDTGKSDGRKGTKIYRYMDYIVSRGRSGSWNPRNMSLVDASGANTYFQMNLYPLAKPSTAAKDWPQINQTLFGFGGSREDRERYADVVRAKRFKTLRDFWRDEQHHPVLTVCFGKTFWPDYQCLFELREQDQKVVPNSDGRILYYPEQRVAFTPFFNPRQLGRTSNLKPLLDLLSKLNVTW